MENDLLAFSIFFSTFVSKARVECLMRETVGWVLSFLNIERRLLDVLFLIYQNLGTFDQLSKMKQMVDVCEVCIYPYALFRDWNGALVRKYTLSTQASVIARSTTVGILRP